MRIYILDIVSFAAAIFLLPLIFSGTSNLSFAKVMDGFILAPFKGYEGSPVVPQIFTTILNNEALRLSTSVPNIAVTHGTGVSFLTLSVLQLYLRGRVDLASMAVNPYATHGANETRDSLLDPMWMREHHYAMSFRLPFGTQVRAMDQNFLAPRALAVRDLAVAAGTERSAAVAAKYLPFHFAFMSERFEVVLLDTELNFKWLSQAPAAAAGAAMVTGHHVAVVPTVLTTRGDPGLVVGAAMHHSTDGARKNVFVGYSAATGEVLWKSDVALGSTEAGVHEGSPLPRKAQRAVDDDAEAGAEKVLTDGGAGVGGEAAFANRPFVFEPSHALRRFVSCTQYRQNSPQHGDPHYFLPVSIQKRNPALFAGLDTDAAAASPDTVAFVSDDHIVLLDALSGAELSSIIKHRSVTLAPGPAAKTGLRLLYTSTVDTVAGSTAFAVAVDYDEDSGQGSVAWKIPLRSSTLPSTVLSGLDDTPTTAARLPLLDTAATPPLLVWRSALELPDSLFVTSSGFVHLLRSDGRVRWSTPLPGGGELDKEVAYLSLQRLSADENGTVILVEFGEHLVLINPSNGQVALNIAYPYPSSITREKEKREKEALGLPESAHDNSGVSASDDYDPHKATQMYQEDNSKGRSVIFGDILSPLPGPTPRTMFIRTGNGLDAYQPNMGKSVSGIQRILRLVSLGLVALSLAIGFRRLPKVEGRGRTED